MSEKDPYEDKKKSETQRTMGGERDTERNATMSEGEDETKDEETEEETQ
jgi:hypothetical protein